MKLEMRKRRKSRDEEAVSRFHLSHTIERKLVLSTSLLLNQKKQISFSSFFFFFLAPWLQQLRLPRPHSLSSQVEEEAPPPHVLHKNVEPTWGFRDAVVCGFSRRRARKSRSDRRREWTRGSTGRTRTKGGSEATARVRRRVRSGWVQRRSRGISWGRSSRICSTSPPIPTTSEHHSDNCSSSFLLFFISCFFAFCGSVCSII